MTNNEGASIAHLVSKVHLSGATADSVKTKALEMLRKYNSKMGRSSGILGNLQLAKPAVVVDLACTCGDVYVDRQVDVKVLQRMSGVTPAQYQKVRSVMMKVVGVKQQVSPRDVCIQFGCLKLEKIVRETLEEYDARRQAGGSGGLGGSAASTGRRRDVSGLDGDGFGRHGRWPPRLVGAAFTLVADAYSTRVDKKRLIAALGLQQREYKVALEAMGKDMHDVFFDDEDDEEDEEGEEEGGGEGDVRAAGNDEAAASPQKQKPQHKREETLVVVGRKSPRLAK